MAGKQAYADLEIKQVGRGKHLVLLHSLLTDADAFRQILPGLKQNRRVSVPSLPGYGQSPRSDGSVPDVARQLADCLASLAIDRFDVIGNGYGGFVALALAQQFGERIDRLVLLDSAAHFPAAGKAGVRLMKENVQTGGMSAVVSVALRRLFPETFIAANPGIVEGYRNSLLGFDPIAFAQTCQNLIDVDLRDGLSKIRNETLVVVGLEDAATPPPLAHELAAGIPGARLVEIPACGHAPHIQEPERILVILKEFLS